MSTPRFSRPVASQPSSALQRITERDYLNDSRAVPWPGRVAQGGSPCGGGWERGMRDRLTFGFLATDDSGAPPGALMWSTS